MAADVLELEPLFPDDDEGAILARMRADANEGLDPAVDVDRWVDTREGSHWFVCAMPGVREIARLYDLAGTEVVAAGMPVWSWGQYLDDHAEVQSIVRLAATRALGSVTITAPEGTVISPGTVVGVTPASPGDDPPEFEVLVGGVVGETGSIALDVQATEPGEEGNVGAGAVSYVLTLPTATVTNPSAIEGGSAVESDEALRARVLAAYLGQGAGNRRDYVRWASAWEGVGRVTVIPLYAGPGTVKVIVTDANGQPLPDSILAGLQNDLDPEPLSGQGAGRAPVSAHVLVTTATALVVPVTAVVELEDGYSLDGAGGTIAILDDIVTALRAYIESVEPGDEIVYQRVRGCIVTVQGVHDLGAVGVGGGTANIPVDDDPAQVPQLTIVADAISAGSV